MSNDATLIQPTENASTALARVVTDLDPAAAQSLRATFETMFAQADEWIARARDIKVTSEDQKREMKFARNSRLALKDIRVNAEKTRKKLKEDSVRTGRAIDGLANVVKALVEPIEEYLLEQETFGERAAKARQDALRTDRLVVLRALGSDPSTLVDLGTMGEEAWEAVRENAQLLDNARREEAAKQEAIRAEVERLAAAKREEERQTAIKAEAERVERQRAADEEIARLKAEAEQRDASARLERERIEAERRAEQEKARRENEAKEAEARRAREEKAAAEAALAAEKERVARTERERLAAEEKRVAAEARAKAAAEAAPDREKLLAFAAALRGTPVPTLGTARGKQIVTGTLGRLIKLAEQVEEAARAMGGAS